MRHVSLIGAATVCLLALEATETAVAGEGKRQRLPKPAKEFEQGPLTRQQRRWRERRGLPC